MFAKLTQRKTSQNSIDLIIVKKINQDFEKTGASGQGTVMELNKWDTQVDKGINCCHLDIIS